MIIVGFVLMWQLIKLFVAIGERYFLVGLLTILAPWAFAMGGSRNTSDIFKGWARMYGSMCLMMVLNVVFLKMLLSVMGNVPSGPGVVPWLIFCVAITRAARKIDSIITKIGLNPAQTGGIGRGLPGMLSYMVLRAISSNVVKAVGASAGGGASPQANAANRSGGPRTGLGGRAYSRTNTNNRASTNSRANTSSQGTTQNEFYRVLNAKRSLDKKTPGGLFIVI